MSGQLYEFSPAFVERQHLILMGVNYSYAYTYLTLYLELNLYLAQNKYVRRGPPPRTDFGGHNTHRERAHNILTIIATIARIDFFVIELVLQYFNNYLAEEKLSIS